MFYALKLADIYRTAMLARGMDLFLLCHHKTFCNDKPVCDVIEGLEQPLSLVWLYNKCLLVLVDSTACKKKNVRDVKVKKVCHNLPF